MGSQTPLKLAVEHEHIEMITMLLEAGARPDLTDYADDTPLHLAVRKNNLEIVKLLVAKRGDLEIIAKDHNRLSSAYTALQLAMGVGTESINIEIVKVLIKAGANVNAQTSSDQEAPLHWAAASNNQEAITVLLQAGANVNVKNSFDHTPLVYALRGKREDAVRVLVQAGADVNARDRYNNTPLIEAIKQDLPTAVKILLQAGADVNIKNNEGRTALSFAEYSTPAIADLLRQHRVK